MGDVAFFMLSWYFIDWKNETPVAHCPFSQCMDFEKYFTFDQFEFPVPRVIGT